MSIDGENKLYKKILDEAPLVIFVLDSKWRFTYINKKAREFTGRKIEELVGKKILTEFPSFKNTGFYERYKQVYQTKKPTDFETYHSEHDRWYQVRARPFEDGILVSYESIDKRKRMEQELSSQKDQMVFAQEVGNLGNFEWNMQTGKFHLSEGLERLYAISRGERSETYRDWLSRIDRRDRKWVDSKMRSAIEKQGELYIEFRIDCPDTSTTWIALKGRALYSDDKKPLKLVGVQMDISDRKHTEKYLQYLSEVSKLLSASLDYKTTLRAAVELAVPHIADWCSIDMLSDDGSLELLSVAHRDPGKVKWAKDLRKKQPPRLDSDTGVGKVIRTGEPEFYPMITDEMLQAAAKNKKELTLLRKIGFTSVIILPLRSQGDVVGTLSLVSSESGYQYTSHDLYLAQQLAERASLAIENALLYTRSEAHKERLDTMISNVPGVVWEAYGKPDSNKQRIDFVSEHVEDMLGYSVEEWTSTPNFWYKIVHPDDKEKARRRASELYENGKSGTNVFRWVKKSGEAIWVESHSSAICDPKGNVIGLRGVTMDINERMELENRKDDFISMASHELKTPLTSLKMYTQLICRKADESDLEGVGRLATGMEGQIDRLSTLVAELLDLSKLQSGKMSYRREEVSLDNLIREVASDMQMYEPGRDIEVNGTIPEAVEVDRERIGQVVTNLLSNALKYSPQNEKVEVNLKSNGDSVYFTVKDYGIGIPKAHQARIFERFYQVNEPVEKTYPGLGIGLYIASEIVKSHGGTITVNSEKGKGSLFKVKLPKNGKG